MRRSLGFPRLSPSMITTPTAWRIASGVDNVSPNRTCGPIVDSCCAEHLRVARLPPPHRGQGCAPRRRAVNGGTRTVPRATCVTSPVLAHAHTPLHTSHALECSSRKVASSVRKLLVACALLVMLTLAACGGGGGSRTRGSTLSLWTRAFSRAPPLPNNIAPPATVHHTPDR